jgi:hypothetical protein
LRDTFNENELFCVGFYSILLSEFRPGEKALFCWVSKATTSEKRFQGPLVQRMKLICNESKNFVRTKDERHCLLFTMPREEHTGGKKMKWNLSALPNA